MEAIVTVELRFSGGYKYTSQYKGKEITVVPAYGWHGLYVGFTNQAGELATYMTPVTETDIVAGMLKNGFRPLFMRWCMEESREYGFNPFVQDVKRLCNHSPHVYVTHDLDDDLIKIGTSGNIASRLRSLYAQKGHTFKMLGIMQGSHNAENAIHKAFKEHLAMGREWFRPHPDIYDFVEQYTFHPETGHRHPSTAI